MTRILGKVFVSDSGGTKSARVGHVMDIKSSFP